MTCILLYVQALNEEKQIGATIQTLRELQPPAHEIIVIDGGSSDRWGGMLHSSPWDMNVGRLLLRKISQRVSTLLQGLTVMHDVAGLCN